MRVGMRREHHEVMVVVTVGLIESRKRISVTAAFADVGKVVAEMLGRFEFNFFPDRVGDRAPPGSPLRGTGRAWSRSRFRTHSSRTNRFR